MADASVLFTQPMQCVKRVVWFHLTNTVVTTRVSDLRTWRLQRLHLAREVGATPR